MSLLDIAAFRRMPLRQEPFPFLVVPEFLKAECLRPVLADFPVIEYAGLMPLAELDYGPRFAALIEEIRGSELEAAFAEKFAVDLRHKPLMITVRGRAQARDGRIHTDSESKIISALLYLNTGWQSQEGRLRFLAGPDDIEDVVEEVPPSGGTLAAFRRSSRSYHGHEPYVGQRRYVMFNWMVDRSAWRRELARHRLSACVKKVLDVI